MLHDFDEINRILNEMVDEGLVEPIDDGSLQTDFYDWADVVGILDEVEPDVTIDAPPPKEGLTLEELIFYGP